MKNLTALIAITTLGALASWTSAQADAGAAADSVKVNYSDLNLSHDHGVAALYGRLESAAANLCQGLAFGRTAAQMNPYHSCIHTILSNTITSIKRPQLTAYAAARGVVGGNLTAVDGHR